MSESRIRNTRRNVIFSYLDTGITLIFSFVSRSIIIRVLGDSYLGLSSLFTSILQVLNMAELGFSSAIVFNMYKPLAEGDTEKVRALLSYYRKIYRIVGCLIVAVGVALIPVLPSLIKDEIPPDVNLYALYLFFLADTGISYFVFAYKAALLNALQRMDLTKIAYSAANVTQQILQIICLLVWKNYYIFLLIRIISTVCKNLFAAWIANRQYPEYYCSGEVSRETKKDIISRVKGLLLCNISAVTYTTLDSIILSAFIGLAAVTKYNNYLIISNQVLVFIAMIREAMQASVGNSIAKESKEKNHRDMLLWQFLFSAIATWCITCMVSLYQPFMLIWMGEEWLLGMTDVILICLWFFVIVSQHPVLLYMGGNGLWWEMRWPYILSTVCNLVLNIVLGKIIGITGIILSTVIAATVFGLIWQCSIVFRIYFGEGRKQFFIRTGGYLLICAVSSAGAYGLNELIPVTGIPGLACRVAVCTVVSAGIMLLAFRKLPVWQEAKGFVRQVLKK